jgi:hypothetical protein
MNQVVHAKWWRVPVDQVPRTADHEAQLQWLYDWWELIDAWISQDRQTGTAASALTPRQQTGPSDT